MNGPIMSLNRNYGCLFSSKNTFLAMKSNWTLNIAMKTSFDYEGLK